MYKELIKELKHTSSPANTQHTLGPTGLPLNRLHFWLVGLKLFIKSTSDGRKFLSTKHLLISTFLFHALSLLIFIYLLTIHTNSISLSLIHIHIYSGLPEPHDTTRPRTYGFPEGMQNNILFSLSQQENYYILNSFNGECCIYLRKKKLLLS